MAVQVAEQIDVRATAVFLPMSNSASLQMRQGRGTDCRDGYSTIIWSFPVRFWSKLVCWRMRSAGRIGQLAASAPNPFGPNSFQRHKQSTHRVGHVFARSDYRKQVNEHGCWDQYG